MHGINKDINRAGVYHNPMIRLIYEDVRMHSAKIWYALPKSLNGWAFNPADSLGDMNLQIALNYGHLDVVNRNTAFERNLRFERFWKTLTFYNTFYRVADHWCHIGYKSYAILIMTEASQQWHPALSKKSDCGSPSHHWSMKSGQTEKTLQTALPQGSTVP